MLPGLGNLALWSTSALWATYIFRGSWEVLGPWGLRPSGPSLPVPLSVYNTDTVNTFRKGVCKVK